MLKPNNLDRSALIFLLLPPPSGFSEVDLEADWGFGRGLLHLSIYSVIPIFDYIRKPHSVPYIGHLE